MMRFREFSNGCCLARYASDPIIQFINVLIEFRNPFAYSTLFESQSNMLYNIYYFQFLIEVLNISLDCTLPGEISMAIW